MKKTLLASLLMGIGTAAMAQATYTDANGDTYEFKKHAYLQLQGGVQHTLGEAKFGDLLSPNVQLGLGYQFNPWFGARIAVDAWQSKGGWNGYRLTPTSVPSNVTYKYKFVAPTIDFMFNLSNAFCGYNPLRVMNVSAFIGGGANIGFSNGEANDLCSQGYDMRYIWDGTKVRAVGKAGLAVDFRLSDAVSLGVEGNANLLNDHYNSKKAGNADWYFNVLAGLKINLGKSYTKKAKEVPAAPKAVAPAAKVEEPAPVQTPAPVETKKEEPMRIDVFFRINTSTVVASEEDKVAKLVNYLNEHKDAKVNVTGYADAGTGNDRVNDRIAKLRAASVVKMLTTKYGISADRITSDSKGAKVQPFSENDKNRVSICIIE